MFFTAQLDDLGQSIGVQTDILKTGIALISSFLLSPIYRLVRARTGRNLLSIVLGAYLLGFILGEWSLFILGGMVVPYGLMQIFKKPLLVTVVSSFFLLLFVHGYRFIFLHSVWRVDCSVFVMLLVTKITYYGKWLESEGTKEPHSFWDYMGYNLFFPGVVVGPTFGFEVYLTFVQNKLEAVEKKTSLFKALLPFFIAFPFMIITIALMPTFHPRWVLENQDYLQLHILLKILLLNLVGFIYRLKFYSAWYFGQASANLSGLSLSPSGEYDAVTAVSLKFEWQPNPRNKTEHWNASMQDWLKKVVYESLVTKIGGTGAFVGTFIISAYWHGIYLTYYAGFIMWGILLHITKWAYKWSQVLPRKLTSSRLFSFLTFFISANFMTYIGMFIVVLHWQDAVAFHADIYHWGTITLVLLLVLSLTVRPPRVRKQQ